MVSPVFISSLVTVLPAMAGLWWFLKRYEGYFEDARVFFALIVGFFTGLGASAFELFTGFGNPDFVAAAGPGSAFLFFVVGYAFFESGVKTIVLGLRRFRGRKDTPYYGAALGLGFGAMLALMVVAVALQTGRDTGRPYEGWALAGLVALAVGSVFAHGATTVYIGKGSADSKLWRGWGIGTLLQMPILGALWLYWPSLGNGNAIVVFPSALALVYGTALLWITQKRVLDKIVPKEIQDQMRRQQRRAARGLAAASHDEEE